MLASLAQSSEHHYCNVIVISSILIQALYLYRFFLMFDNLSSPFSRTFISIYNVMELFYSQFSFIYDLTQMKTLFYFILSNKDNMTYWNSSCTTFNACPARIIYPVLIMNKLTYCNVHVMTYIFLPTMVKKTSYKHKKVTITADKVLDLEKEISDVCI